MVLEFVILIVSSSPTSIDILEFSISIASTDTLHIANISISFSGVYPSSI